MAEERLQKILARAGVASRRAAESIITDGRVRVNGRVVTELGSKADSYRDKIELDGRRIVMERPAYYLVHKPREMVTTLDDPEGRAHLGEILSKMSERLYPIGRLDYHTSGALLVTNDGDLTDALLHPRRKVPKVYAAKLRGHLGVPELDKLRNGVALDDGYLTKAAEVFVIREEVKNTWIQLTLYEGKNRQIHRMADAIGHPVQRLVRLSFAGIDTEGLRPGESRLLNKREIEKLEKLYLRPARIAKATDAADELEAEDRAAHRLGPQHRQQGPHALASTEQGVARRLRQRGRPARVDATARFGLGVLLEEGLQPCHVPASLSWIFSSSMRRSAPLSRPAPLRARSTPSA